MIDSFCLGIVVGLVAGVWLNSYLRKAWDAGEGT